MTPALQVYDRRERWLVRAADWCLAPLRWWPSPRPPARVQRVLLLRLERIGDLLMTLDAIRDARHAWPDADIDLAVGAWNVPLAQLIADVSSVTVATPPWLVRGDGSASWPALLHAARAWRRRRYDVVVNFEPDIRSNALAWISGAPVRVGYRSGGGGAYLTSALVYDATAHVSANARRLIAHASSRPGEHHTEARTPQPRLTVPEPSRARAAELLAGAARPLVGVHVSGGRESKQWHLDRFASVAQRIARERGATIVLTGSAADRPMVEQVRGQIGGVPVIALPGVPTLPELAALLGMLDVYVTSDTGPMHLAAAMGTPVVALFGPADPARYGPRAPHERVVRVDLPCSPCGQVRLPPERCRGHVPDCMDGITVERVVADALELLDTAREVPA